MVWGQAGAAAVLYFFVAFGAELVVADVVFSWVDGCLKLLLQVVELFVGEVAFEDAVLDALPVVFHMVGYAAQAFGVGDVEADDVEVSHSR